MQREIERKCEAAEKLREVGRSGELAKVLEKIEKKRAAKQQAEVGVREQSVR